MTTYIPVPVEAEPVDLANEAFDYLGSKVPGWLPSNGNLEAWLIEALAQIAGELRTLVGLVPDSIFAYYGASVLGLAPYPAVQATAVTTWEAVDDVGYTVDAGTVIALTPPASNQAFGFAVSAAFSIPPGQTRVSGIECRALEAGAAASGLSGTISVVDALVFVHAVTLDQPTSGGQDAETTDAYLVRLSALLTLLAPRPILPQDFAVLAQRSVEGVARATAIDLYNPSTGETNCPRCVTVALVDADGNPVPAAVKAEVDALLQAEREVNFLAFVTDPTYTTVDVTFTLVTFPGFDPDDVASRTIAAVENYLSPGAWGVPPFGDTSARSWINDTKVRYLEVAEQINRVEGVHFITFLSIGFAGQAQGQVDLDLGGVAPLPKPGSVTGTATAGS